MMWATVGGVRFEGDGGTGAFMLTDMKGWRARPGMRREQTDRPAAHGTFPAPGYLGGRLITLEGEIYSDGELEQAHHINMLQGVLADGSTGRLVVADPDTLWADVEAHGEPSISITVPVLAKFQAQFWAPDPRRYGESRVSDPGTNLFVHQFGNFPADPVIEITGSMPSGYAIFGPGGTQFVVTRGIKPGQTHRIDMRTGRLTQDGTVVLGGVLQAQLWQVPPGGQANMVLFPLSGTGQMRVTVTDTYV